MDIKVKTAVSVCDTYSVDTLEDLRKVEKMMKKDSLIYSYRIHNKEIG